MNAFNNKIYFVVEVNEFHINLMMMGYSLRYVFIHLLP